jgi:hypothetical protein
VADQAQQGALLLAGHVEVVEGPSATAGVTAEGKVGSTADQGSGGHGSSSGGWMPTIAFKVRRKCSDGVKGRRIRRELLTKAACGVSSSLSV